MSTQRPSPRVGRGRAGRARRRVGRPRGAAGCQAPPRGASRGKRKVRTGQFVGASSGRIARSRIRVSTASSAAHAAMGAAAEVVGTRHATVATRRRRKRRWSPRSRRRWHPLQQGQERRAHHAENARESEGGDETDVGVRPRAAASSAEPSRRQHPGQGPSANGIGASSRRRPSGTSRWSRETTRTPTARWTASAVARRSASSWPMARRGVRHPRGYARRRATGRAARDDRRGDASSREGTSAKPSGPTPTPSRSEAIVHRADENRRWVRGGRRTNELNRGRAGERRRAKLMRGGGRLRRRE